ncbi:MAG: (Fe-S)-binding protein [Candidatus Methanomethylicia archaeon]
MIAQREHFIMVPEWAILVLYISIILSLIFTMYGIYHKFSIYGIRNFNFLSTLRRKTGFILQSELRLLRERYGGLMHTLIVAGLVVLAIGTFLVFFEYDILMKINPNYRILTGSIYLAYEFILDLAGLLLIIGLVMAITRRTIFKPSRLENRVEDIVVLLLLLYGGLSGFILEGLRIAAKGLQYNQLSFIGYILSIAFLNINGIAEMYLAIWISHAITLAVTLPLFIYSKLRHFPLFFISPPYSVYEFKPSFSLNEVLKSKKIDFKVGLESIDALNWGQRVNIDACVNCGRCRDVCPAYRANKILSPKAVIQKLREFMAKNICNAITDSALHENEIWACTTCGECVVTCPIFINPLNYILESRRYLVTNLGKVPTNALFNIMVRGNPYGLPRSDRRNWMKDLNVSYAKEGEEVEVILWVGCAGAYDSRAQKIAKSLVSLLNKLNIKFAVLREEECCGELARRLGDEILFQEIVGRNIEIFRKYKFKQIVTLCPHCYNTFRNDYSDFNIKLNVKSHVELIYDLIANGRIKTFSPLNKTIVYHDPCYLRNYNGVLVEPRKIIKSIPELKIVETSKHFCCGGGGGGNWIESEGVRINVQRLEDIAMKNPDVIATACPYCVSMFEDALKFKDLEGKFEVKDLCEIVCGVLR